MKRKGGFPCCLIGFYLGRVFPRLDERDPGPGLLAGFRIRSASSLSSNTLRI